MWVYLQLAAAPEWAMDTMYYRQPVESNGCLINTTAQPVYDVIAQIFVAVVAHGGPGI